MTAVSVNGVVIEERSIAAETQNFVADSIGEARAAAATALVIRELLLQEARRRGLAPQPRRLEQGVRETDEEALVRQLLDDEVVTPQADEATCRRYYDNNRQRFRSPDLFEAAHILFAAAPEDTQAYADAISSAERAIAALDRNPGAFGEIARHRSACSSARNDGRLGQVARGETVPELETFLLNLEEGQLCPVPVRTRFGAHVLRLDRRIAGRDLPFEAVRQAIADYLIEASFRRAVAQYIAILAGRARITGIDLGGAPSPLVQ